MLQLVNQTPFVASLIPINDKSGDATVVVVVKATYDIEAGRSLKLAPAQRPIELADVHRRAGRVQHHLPIRRRALQAGHRRRAGRRGPRARRPPGDGAGRSALGRADRQDGACWRIWVGSRSVRATSGPRLRSPSPACRSPTSARLAAPITAAEASKHGWESRNPVGTGFRTNPAAVIATGPTSRTRAR